MPENDDEMPLTGGSILPSIIEEDTLPIAPALTTKSTLNEAKDADIEVANLALSWCYAAVEKAKTPSTLLKCIDTTMRTLKARRELLNLQYGYTDSGKSGGAFTPYED